MTKVDNLYNEALRLFNGDNFYPQNIKNNIFATKCAPLYFYLNMFNIVAQAGIVAGKKEYPNERWVSDCYSIVKLVLETGVKMQIEGLNNFKSLDTPCVFISNHMSTLETFILPAFIAPFKGVTFAIKKSLIEYPLFGNILKAQDPIIVGRENPREDLTTVLTKGCEILKQNKSVIIFPQSTRMVEFDPQKFNTIGIKLAKKADVPVVPIALSTQYWGNGKLLKDFGKISTDKDVHIKFGKAMSIEGNGKEQHSQIVDFIQNNLNNWQKK